MIRINTGFIKQVFCLPILSLAQKLVSWSKVCQLWIYWHNLDTST